MAVVYAAIIALESRTAFYLSSVFCMMYLTVCHLWRMYFDYGGYELDITGPLMVLVQRLSMLAANLDDGESIKKFKQDIFRNGALATSTPIGNRSSSPSPKDGHKVSLDKLKMSDAQKRFAVYQKPTPMQFISYCINFQTVIIGPLISYRDHDIYIRGCEAEHLETEAKRAHFAKHRESILEARETVIMYGKQAFYYGFLYIFVAGYFPTNFFLSDTFLQYSFTWRFLYLLLTANFMRQQYYFGWSFSALCCLLSGLGFSDLDDDMNPKYTLVKNFRFRSVEFAGSLKELIDNWNISTLHWLRLVIYDRCPRKYASPMVFIASCIWHGFYPGYYMFFVSMGYFFYVSFTIDQYHYKLIESPLALAHFWSKLSRVFHREVRPAMFKKFLGILPPERPRKQNWLERTSIFNVIMAAMGLSEPVSMDTKALDENTRLFCQRYDFFTWFVTYVVVNYTATAFVVLAFYDSLVVWA
ncbi:Lysophospholipid acyltransferase 1, partial [Cichlidogyrus casuarinus]